MLLAVCFSICFTSTIALAHPGRTDSSGGHYVRSPGWGYPVGSYHYHNGGNSTSSSSSGSIDSSTEYDKGFDNNSQENSLEKEISRQKQLNGDYYKGLGDGLSVAIPSTAKTPQYSDDGERQMKYAMGFNAGIQQTIKNDYDLGYKEGKNSHPSKPSNYSTDNMRMDSYTKGFKSGLKDFYVENYKCNINVYKESAYNDGYNYAFENLVCDSPKNYTSHFESYISNSGVFSECTDNDLKNIKASNNIDNNLLVQAYKDGFAANSEVKSISKQGFNDGILLKSYGNVEKGANIYKAGFTKGRVVTVVAIFILFSLTFLSFYFYKIKNKK